MWVCAQSVAEGPPLCGAEHRVVLLIIASSAAGLTLILRRVRGSRHEALVHRTICWFLCGWLLAGATAAQTWRIAARTWTVRESLPLHLCDLAVIAAALALLGAGHGRRPSVGWPQRPAGAANPRTARLSLWQRLYELAYFWGLGGTVQAVVTPDVAARFPDASCVHYFALHGGIVVAVVVMTAGVRLRPLPGAVARVWMTTFLLAAGVMAIDWLTGANYMYLFGPPQHPTLYDAFGPWPYALISLVAAGTVIFVLLYLPYWLHDRWRAARR